jgi:ParB-like chromosome segregation protein Spo0J
MTTTLKGAKRTDAFMFWGDDIENMEVMENTRWGELDHAHMLDIASQIAKDGQLSPVCVRKIPGDKVQLISGATRRAAILHINANLGEYGLPKVMPLIAVEHKLDDRGAFKASFSINALTKRLSVMDLANTVVLFSRLKMTGKEIAEAMSTSSREFTEVRVSALKRYITDLPLETQQALHRGDLTEGAALAMLQAKMDPEEMKATTSKVVKKELATKDVVKKVSAKKRARGKSIKRTMGDLRGFLAGIDTKKSQKLLDWLDGKKVSEPVLIQIFKDPDTKRASPPVAKKKSRAQKKKSSKQSTASTSAPTQPTGIDLSSNPEVPNLIL